VGNLKKSHRDWRGVGAGSVISVTWFSCAQRVGGRQRRVGLQPEGESLDCDQSNLWRATVNYEPRPARPGVLVIGEFKEYESTFSMQPGWDPELETERWRDVARGFSDDWETHRDVYRKWVLNEHGKNPWAPEAYDAGQLDATDFVLATARKFGPCLTTNAAGQSVGVVIEYRLESGGDWQRWAGPVWVSDEECAIYLGGETLPADYYQAVVAGEAFLRVTATVAADVRAYASQPGDHGLPRRTIRAPGLTRRTIHWGSQIQKGESECRAGERDDMPLLANIARRANAAMGQAVAAKVTLAWLDPSCQVGDCIERIEGRAIELGSHPEALAYVSSVRHDIAEQTTHLEVNG
jgi:hypothetical protein